MHTFRIHKSFATLPVCHVTNVCAGKNKENKSSINKNRNTMETGGVRQRIDPPGVYSWTWPLVLIV